MTEEIFHNNTCRYADITKSKVYSIHVYRCIVRYTWNCLDNVCTKIKPCLNHSYVELWAKYTPPSSLSASSWRWARTSCWRFLPGRWRSQTLESRTHPEKCPSLYPCATPSLNLNSLKLNLLTYHVNFAI